MTYGSSVWLEAPCWWPSLSFMHCTSSILSGDFHVALTSVPVCAGLAALLVLTLPEYRHPEHRPGARTPRPRAAPATSGV